MSKISSAETASQDVDMRKLRDDAEDVVQMLIERDAEADKLARQVSIMRHALAELGKQPWQRCPSTHCERSQECRSPNECSAIGMKLAKRALDAAFRVAIGQEPDPFVAPVAIPPFGSEDREPPR